jgi:hypothetical protein
MKRFILPLAALLLWPLSASAQGQGGSAPVSAADAATIRGVIAQQVEAFRRDDGPAAFAFASPGIQAIFRTPDIFMEMVRSGYQPVYRPRTMEFRGLDMTAEGLVQQVLFVGPDGRPVLALYHMEHETDGTWRISGCELAVPSDRTT